MYRLADNFSTCEQGILVPVETQEKHNKLGLGAEKPKIQRRKKTEMAQATTSQHSEQVSDGASSSWAAIKSSNIGFQVFTRSRFLSGMYMCYMVD